MAEHNARGGDGQRKLEVGYVLFMDVVGYSRLMIEEQQRILEELQKTVRGLEEFQKATEEKRLIRLPTGDGMALVFFGDPEAPLRASVELSRALREHPSVKLRMGIHTGPVYRVEDINANLNVAGGGVNLAQRVMDCGDAGHILVSEDSARFFLQVGEWAERLHNVGITRVKHGVRLHIYSLFVSEVGNPRLPFKIRRERFRRRGLVGTVLAVLLVGLGGLIWQVIKGPPPPSLVYSQLTTNSAKSPLNTAAISPDGRFLAYVDGRGIFVRDIETREDKQLPTPEGATLGSPNWSLAWMPNSSQLLVSGLLDRGEFESISLFHPLIGPSPHVIAKEAWFPSVSSDASMIAYIDTETERTIWGVSPDGGDPKRILDAPDGNTFDSICWSPKGRRLAFLETASSDPRNDFIGTVDVDSPAKRTTVFEGKDLVSGPEEESSGLFWLPDNRMIFVRGNPPGSKGSNLWAIRVDSKSGRAVGAATQITNVANNIYHSDLSATRDGRRLVSLLTKFHCEIRLGHLNLGGRSFTSTEDFISEDSNNWADGWTPDSKFLLFTSDRKGGTLGVFRQSATSHTPEAVAVSTESQSHAVASSDGTTYFYWSWPKEEGEYPEKKTLKQIPAAGGVPVSILRSEAGKSGLSCASAAPICLVSEESKDGLDFARLDVTTGTKSNVVKLNFPVTDGYDWDVSPDGQRLAFAHTNMSDNTVQIVTLADRGTKELSVPGWSEFEHLAWDADGTGVYLAAILPKKSALIRVDMTGKTDVLWETGTGYLGLPVPSPDRKSAAFTVCSAGESNAWTIDHF